MTTIPDNLPPRFLNWRMIDGRKVPCKRDGTPCDAHDPANHTDHATALAATTAGYGVAFDLRVEDGLFFLDLDKCGPDWTPEAVAIFTSFNGAWGEVSQSGTGLHILGRCDPLRLIDRRNKWAGWLEFYTTGRFIAFGPSGWAPIGGTATGQDWTDLVQMLAGPGTADWPAGIGRARAWYDPQLDRVHEDAEFRRADLLQLEQIAAGYPSRERFLTELTLDPPDATGGQAGVPLKDDDYLILSTIHSAKGQEWKSVFVLNVVDGCIPSDLGTGTTAEIDEERRLLYVAMTRAKDSLTLTVPLRFYATGQARNGDRHVHATRSRFLPREMLDCFEVTHWSPPILSGASPTAMTVPTIDVSALMRSMWT